MPKLDAVKTLDEISTIIAKDVKRLKKKVSGKRTKKLKDGSVSPKVDPKELSPEEALTLSRHASTLINVQEANDEAREKAKKQLERSSIDELLKQYHSELPKDKQ